MSRSAFATIAKHYGDVLKLDGTPIDKAAILIGRLAAAGFLVVDSEDVGDVVSHGQGAKTIRPPSGRISARRVDDEAKAARA